MNGWTEADQKACEPEGWAIFSTGIDQHPFELQALNPDGEKTPFDCDEAAWWHVAERAEREPKGLHRRALNFLRLHSPTEYEIITEVTNYMEVEDEPPTADPPHAVPGGE